MKKHSDYLNPFQPFAELEVKADPSGRPRDAIENNMCRAVFSALANSQPRDVAKFMETLAGHAQNAELRRQTCELANIIRSADSADVNFGLQTWPKLVDSERQVIKILLVGISTSHDRVWTHDQRFAPENPCADAWIYIPGKLLLVFECKNDEHPLDATQISAYVHALKLVDENRGIPRAEPGKTLESPDQARQVQDACVNAVLDISWSDVVGAFTSVLSLADADIVGRWLCEQTREYIEWHIRPPYRGTQTIVDWLGGPDSPDRRVHLRRLVSKLGDNLRDGPISFAMRKTTRANGNVAWDLRTGAEAAVFVRLCHGKLPLTGGWLGKKADAQIWFHFSSKVDARIGVEYYIQAQGSQANQLDAATWNSASAKHVGRCADDLERAFEKWVPVAPVGSRVTISTVKFRGNKKRNWQGGGETAKDGATVINASPKDGLEFLKENRRKLWRFPLVKDTSEIEGAAKEVRKPDLAVTAPVEADSFVECGNDSVAIQRFLETALAHLDRCRRKPE